MSEAPAPSASRYTQFVFRHAWVILAAAVAVLAGSVFLGSRLELRTSFSELLPSDDPGVVALTKTSDRIGDMSLLLVGIRSSDRAANIRYAAALTEKLRALPPKVVALATYNVRDIRDFFKRNQWLYVSEGDLESIRDRLRHEIAKRKNPLLADLGLDDDEESVDNLRERITKKDPLDGRFPDGVFSDAQGKYVWIAALPPGGMFGERAGESLFHSAEDLIKAMPPSTFHPQMVAEVTGPVATLLANREAIEHDIMWVTGICVLVVAASIFLFFRRFRAVPFIGIPAAIGTVMAFAAAELAFGYVNSSTAFLGSIILGNGINYSIIFMSRYQEERSAGAPTPLAIERALSGVVRGTAVAAICASAAYASLMLTSFRGFYQFGVMGAIGVLCCWVTTFTVLPALLYVADRHTAGAHATRPPLSLAPLGRLLQRRAPLLVGITAVITALSTYGMLHFTSSPFEYDFRRLNARIPVSETKHQFDESQSALFGRWPSPTIILADELGEVEEMRAAIRNQDAPLKDKHVIGQIVTVFDVLPGTPEAQARKLAILEQIRKLKQDKALELASEKDRKQLEKLEIPTDLHLLKPGDLPPLARRPFTEVDGTIGRVLLVYPVEEGLSVWNGRDLLRISSVLQRIYLPATAAHPAKEIDTSGSAVVFSSMIRSVLRDGPRATVASLLAVVILALLIMRPPRAALLAIGTLLVGVLWMIGAAGYAEVKITFLNFIALPITFGIGAEYALNVVSRNRESHDMVRAVVSTGSAVALCSWTTIVGYGSLLVARNQALQGFGAMAILGEVACLLAAIVGLPSLVLWRNRRASARRTAAASAS